MLNQPLQSGEFERYSDDPLVGVHPQIANPFPGLRPFSVDECHLFFGREGQVDKILLQLSKNRFVAVMGFSGSGKSSLMNCGLVPVLYGGFITENGANWNVITARPGASPIANLTDAVVDFMSRTGKINDEDKEIHRAIVNSVLRSGSYGLLEVARYVQLQTDENILLLIDQFEELFRYQEIDSSNPDAANEAHQYVHLMLTAVNQTKAPIYVAITMRSDFIGNCSAFPGLTHVINQSNYLVPQMTREQKKMVIEGPIAVAGGKIAPRLLRTLLSDIGNDQDQLPILQHAMMRTWDYWLMNHEPGEPIDIRHYNAVGKISQALSQHADEAYEELSPRQKEIAEVLFKSITERTQENRGMRRPTRLGLIAQLADAEEADVIDIVNHFRKPGRSFLMPAYHVSLHSDSMVEISHESLMRIWTRLDSWVAEEFDSAQMYKRLSEAAAMYQIGKTGLWRPPDLQLALNWQKKQRPTREWAQRYDEAFERAVVFLDTSRITYEAELKNQEMLQRRLLRRTRATAIIFGILFVIAILFFVFAFMKKLEADEQTRFAELQRKEADQQKQEADKQRVEAERLRGVAEASRAMIEEANKELEKTLNELQTEKDRAESALIKAQLEERKANLASLNEKEARIEAERNRDAAQVQYKRADSLFMLTKAQELSTKSEQEDDDAQLAGLLSMQSFHIHRRYSGRKYDSYIYRGLYSSLTKLIDKTYNEIKVEGVPRNKMASIAVSSKGSNFYAAGSDGRIFQGSINQPLAKPTSYTNAYPLKVITMSSDEKYLVAGSDSSFVLVYDVASGGGKPKTIKGFAGPTNQIKFLPGNGTFLVSSGATGKSTYSLVSVNASTGEVQSLLDTPFEIKTFAISPDGKQVAAGTWGGKVVLIDLASKAITNLADEAGSRILTVKFSPNGKSLAFGTDDIANKRGVVKLINLANKVVRQFTGHRAGVYDVEFSPDGQLLASAGSDRRLQLWVLSNPGDLPIVMDNNSGFVWDIAFASGSNYLVAACSDSEIRVWPTDPSILASQICPHVTRNMSEDEWGKYVGSGIPYEFTCPRAEIKDF